MTSAPIVKGNQAVSTPKQFDSVIGENLTFEGKIVSSGNVRIEGKVVGEINVDGILLVGERAQITGENIYADVLVVGGNLTCNVRARLVELQATARLKGDIYSQSLKMDSGAVLDGRNYPQSE